MRHSTYFFIFTNRCGEWRTKLGQLSIFCTLSVHFLKNSANGAAITHAPVYFATLFLQSLSTLDSSQATPCIFSN